jgi:hypothetical protein
MEFERKRMMFGFWATLGLAGVCGVFMLFGKNDDK